MQEGTFAASCKDYDLISGVAGLIRAEPDDSFGRLSFLVPVLLERFGVRDDISDFAVPADTSLRVRGGGGGDAVLNLGMAHGVLGVVSALSLATEQQVFPLATLTIERACQLIYGALGPRCLDPAPAFCVNGIPDFAPQAAWCYGVLPALWIGGRVDAVGRDPHVLRAWRKGDRWRGAVGAHGRATLCHGFAGIAYHLALLGQAHACPQLWASAIQALEKSFESLMVGPVATLPGIGLLMGELGPISVALSLAGAPRTPAAAPLANLLGLDPCPEHPVGTRSRS